MREYTIQELIDALEAYKKLNASAADKKVVVDVLLSGSWSPATRFTYKLEFVGSAYLAIRVHL